MISVATVIMEIVGLLPGGPFTFLHADKPEQNLDDDATFPICYMDFYVVTDDKLHQSGAITEEYAVTLFWGMKSELDWKSNQHDTDCCVPMMATSRKFITLCQKDSRIREVKSSKRRKVKNFFDVNTSGVLQEIRLTFVDGNSIC